jgi:hypothetical protein
MSKFKNRFAAAPTVGSLNPPYTPPGARELLLYLLGALIVLFARAPRLLLEGRIVAEEGTTYLLYAWNSTPLRAFLAPHQGYFSLMDNGVAFIAARLLPLSVAALLFVWSAALVQLLLLYLVVQCECLRTPRERWTALLALLLVTPSYEIWLNVENSQSLLPVCAAVILISSLDRLYPVKIFTLVLAGFTGPTTIPLTPLFWLRAWKRRSRRALVQAIAVTLPFCVECYLIFRSIATGGRIVQHEWRAMVAYISSRVIVLPFATGRVAHSYDIFLFHHPGQSWELLTSLFLLVAFCSAFAIFRVSSRASLLLLIAALLSSVFSWYGCDPCSFQLLDRSSGGEGRYFYAANAMIFLAAVIAMYRAPRRPLACLSSTAVAILFITGIVHYVRLAPKLEKYPAWLPQVRRWEGDERQPIIIAPDLWRTNPLRLHHQQPNRADLPFNAYDSNNRAPMRE